jgi:hypothetical protein
MPLNPKRVQAVFPEAVDYQDPVDRSAILDRECSVKVRRAEGQLETLRRIEAGLDAIRRVQADFLAAADHYDPVDLVAILHRECVAKIRRAERQFQMLRRLEDRLDAIRLDRRLREIDEY